MAEHASRYQVLALKWRPQRFADVVGQEHITRTLQNTIAQNRVGHAYLFVGPRGIGKTTSARIFAKALNCEAGMNPEPCCQCRSCTEIAEGRSMDVIEMDGASHNGVEDIRELRENVGYRPSRGRFKIYIIDEVHMLSNAAWNALLKTLEEPPEHVKFFFATTEPHKVLPTVVSRCQRFDLRRIAVHTIVQRLQEVTAAEDVPVDDRALAAVARFADGGMRDALSVMDQIVAFHGGRERQEPISESDVIDVFGLVSSRELGRLSETILNHDVAEVMNVIQRLADRGRDLERLYGDLLYYVRNLLMMSADPDDRRNLVEASESEREDMRRIVSNCRLELIPRLLEELVSAENTLKNASNKRVYLEALLVRLMRRMHSVQVDDLIARLNQLRQNGERVELPPSPPSPPSPSTAGESRDEGEARPTAIPPGNAAAQAGSPAAPPPPSEAEETPPATQEAAAPTPVASPGDDESPSIAAESAAASVPAEDAHAGSPEESIPASASLEANEPPPPDYTAHQPPPISSRRSADILHAIIAETGRDAHLRPLKPYLQELKPVSFSHGQLELAYDDEFPEERVNRLREPQHWNRIETIARRLVGDDTVRLFLKRWIDSVSAEEPKRPQPVSKEVQQQVENNLFVREVCELFGGRIVEVRG